MRTLASQICNLEIELCVVANYNPMVCELARLDLRYCHYSIQQLLSSTNHALSLDLWIGLSQMADVKSPTPRTSQCLVHEISKDAHLLNQFINDNFPNCDKPIEIQYESSIIFSKIYKNNQLRKKQKQVFKKNCTRVGWLIFNQKI
jgi:hypothetical protein